MSEKAIHVCEHEGCTNEGNPCWLPDSPIDGMPDYYYCGEHAHDEGFCPGCGWFWAGVESFDFRLNGTQLCQNCYNESEELDFSDDEDWFDDYPDYEDILEDETGGRYIGPGSEYEGGESDVS